MGAYLKKAYLYIETIPDRLYPFACEIEGRWVRGQRSYMRALERAIEKHGPHRLGYKLVVYRATFHFLGSVLFIFFTALLSHRLFGSEVALYLIILVASIALFIQEFYGHPKRYGQSRRKGVADWLTWVVPMVLYVSLGGF